MFWLFGRVYDFVQHGEHEFGALLTVHTYIPAL